MILQFTEGLNSCGGLWDIIKGNSSAFLPVMTHTKWPVSLESFRRMFQISWSPPESNQKVAEETTITCWEEVLTMVNGRLAVQSELINL